MHEITFPILNLKLNINPVLVNIFGLSIYWYAAIIVSGIILCMIICWRKSGRFNIKYEDLQDMALITLPISIICARIYYVIFSLDIYINDPLEILNIRDGGLAIYGGIIGAVITIYTYCKVKKISFIDVLDFLAPCLALGQAIGRWGNFFNREAHGTETNIFCRMGIIENGKYIEVHPTFLYESLGTLTLFIILSIMQKNRKFKGQIVYLYIIGYSILRFFIENLRTDSLMFMGYRVSRSFIISFIYYF